MSIRYTAGIGTIAAMISWGQTKLDLGRQTDNVDFSQATFTRPMKLGNMVPPICQIGEVFFRTNVPAGSNLYGCAATNTWTLEGVSSGGQEVLRLVESSPTEVSVGADCAPTTPCAVRFGSATYRFTGGATVTLTGGTGTVIFYVTPSGVLTAGHNVTLTCSGCVAQPGATGFPADSIPLYALTVTSGQWDGEMLDLRAVLSTKNVSAGSGLQSVNSLGLTTLSVDGAVVAIRTAAPAAAGSTCTAGTWAYDAGYFYVCVSTDTWRRTEITIW